MDAILIFIFMKSQLFVMFKKLLNYKATLAVWIIHLEEWYILSNHILTEYSSLQACDWTQNGIM